MTEAAHRQKDFLSDMAAGVSIEKHPLVISEINWWINGMFRASHCDDKPLQRLGVDWIIFGNSQFYHVDVKRWNGNGSVAIETASNVARGAPGWAVDPSRVTDVILWVKLPVEYIAASYTKLRDATISNLEEWKRIFGERTQTSKSGGDSWKSRHINVPVSELERVGCILCRSTFHHG